MFLTKQATTLRVHAVGIFQGVQVEYSLEYSVLHRQASIHAGLPTICNTEYSNIPIFHYK